MGDKVESRCQYVHGIYVSFAGVSDDGIGLWAKMTLRPQVE